MPFYAPFPFSVCMEKKLVAAVEVSEVEMFCRSGAVGQNSGTELDFQKVQLLEVCFCPNVDFVLFS
jgi:hypothetical protein